MQRAGLITSNRWLHWLVLAIGCLLATGPAHAEKRVALVIGNSAYSHARPLVNPGNDAKLMPDLSAAVDVDMTTEKAGTSSGQSTGSGVGGGS